MLEFRDITIEDRPWITKCMRKSDYRGCEYSFANNMAWRRLHNSKIARFKDFYLCCSMDTEDGIPTFMYPAGSGDDLEVITQMRSFSEHLGKPLKIWNVSEERLKWLREQFPAGFAVDENRDSWDYVYESTELSELSGRKYHQKRNFLHRFAQYHAEYAELTEKDFDDCITMAAGSYNEKLEGDPSAISEQFAIDTYFRNYDILQLQGGVLRVDDKLVAFTVGEPLSSDTFCVHIEKADTDFQGAYNAINQRFSQRIAAQGFRYINREEDMGLPGLRKAKLSYRPAFLVEKYCVTFK